MLLLQGEYDPAMPLWYYEDFDRILPNARLQIVKDAGHFTELEKPDEVSKAILEFLAE
jgi:pimeloyl-ACP methyl ester carboxylesterase